MSPFGMARKRSGRRQGHCRTSWSNRPGARCPGSCRRIARASLSSLRMARSRTAWPMPPTMRAPHDPATCPTSVRPPSGKILATARQGQGQGRKRRPSPPHHAQALSQARENHGADHLRNSISCAEAYKPDMRPPPAAPDLHRDAIKGPVSRISCRPAIGQRVPPVRFERTTYRLQGGCSGRTELRGRRVVCLNDTVLLGKAILKFRMTSCGHRPQPRN